MSRSNLLATDFPEITSARRKKAARAQRMDRANKKLACSQRSNCSPAVPLEHVDYDANAGMHRVVQVIPSIHVVDVNVVGVAPADWPWLAESKPIAAVLETRTPLENHRLVDDEHMLTAEAGPKMVFRNAAIVMHLFRPGFLCLLLGCALFLRGVLS